MRSRHSPRWAFIQRLDIPDTRKPSRVYLRRWRVVQTPWFGILWHRIFLADVDRDPHDHPWPFLSIVLRGGYRETIYLNPSSTLDRPVSVVRRRYSWHVIDAATAHRITDVVPGTVTLVLTGRRLREWGFWTRGGFVDWRSYRRTPGGT